MRRTAASFFEAGLQHEAEGSSPFGGFEVVLPAFCVFFGQVVLAVEEFEGAAGSGGCISSLEVFVKAARQVG